MQYLKRKYNLLVGEQTGEAIKIQIGSALSTFGQATDDGNKGQEFNRRRAQNVNNRR